MTRRARITHVTEIVDGATVGPITRILAPDDATPGHLVAVDAAGQPVVLVPPPDALDDLTDVDAPAPEDGDVLTYSGSAGAWIAAEGGGGGSGGDGWEVLSAAVAQPVGSYTEIAEITASDVGWGTSPGVALVALNIAGIGYRAVSYHVIPLAGAMTSGGEWCIVPPQAWARYDQPPRGGRLEATCDGQTMKLRAVQTGGYGPFTATAHIQVMAVPSATITPIFGTGTSTATKPYPALTPIRYTVRRNLVSTVGNYIEIGSWTGMENGIVLRVSVTLCAAFKRTALTYLLVAASDTPTGWREVPPVGQATPYSNRQTVLEADVTSGTLSLRLKHSVGSYSGEHVVVMEMLNLEHPSIDGAQNYTATPIFIPSSGTGTSGVTATTTPWDVGDRLPVRNVTSAYTASTGDRCIIADTTSGGFTIALPAPNAYHVQGQRIYIKNKGSNNLTLDPAGSAQIDGATTKVLAAGTSVVAICSGTDWQTW